MILILQLRKQEYKKILKATNALLFEIINHYGTFNESKVCLQ